MEIIEAIGLLFDVVSVLGEIVCGLAEMCADSATDEARKNR